MSSNPHASHSPPTLVHYIKTHQQHTNQVAQLVASPCPWWNPGCHQACGGLVEACWPQSAAAGAARAWLSGYAAECQQGGGCHGSHQGGCCHGYCSAAGCSGGAGYCGGYIDGCHAHALCHCGRALCRVWELPCRWSSHQTAHSPKHLLEKLSLSLKFSSNCTPAQSSCYWKALSPMRLSKDTQSHDRQNAIQV